MSAPYVSLIENGRKVPDEAIAVALADALGEDRALYRAWVRARKRADLDTALSAAEILKELLSGLSPPETSPAPGSSRYDAGSAPAPATSLARLRVPVIPEGVDPGGSLRPACEVLEWLSLDASQLPPEWRDRLDRPFAWRLTGASVVRVRQRMRPPGYALVLRDFMPVTHDHVYAVRHLGRVVLSHLMWNGRHLLLLPAEGESDFVVLDAAGASPVSALVLGVVVAVPFARGGAS